MIPVFDITRQNKILKEELNSAISSVIERGIFILGPKVEEFEKEFAKYVGVKFAVGVSSGTEALTLSLMALGIKKGDEVILPANCYPTVFGITSLGVIPKLVDINPETYNIDPQKIPQAISKKTKAIILVHLYGQPADMGRIMAIGKKYKLPVIEDCAQAHGATIKIPHNPFLQGEGGQKVGSMGDIGCFSFYPTKNLGCFGDGGMVVTNDEDIYKKVKKLRMYGEEKRYQSTLLGINSRLDELQAAILLVKLKYLDKWNERRREIANLYNRYFNLRVLKSGSTGPAAPHPQQVLLSTSSQMRPSWGSPSRVTPAALFLPIEAEYSKHVYHLYVIRTKKRDALKKYLEEKEIGTAIHYPIPIHLVPSMQFLGYKKGDFPESEAASREILSLPMCPELDKTSIEKVANTIRNFF